MLGYDLSRPPEAGHGARVAVLLHGRGSHRGELQALRGRLPDDLVLVTPQAPFPGHPWGYGPGWAWYRHIEADRVDDDSLQRSLQALGVFLSELPALLRLRPGPIFLGGFSQGGTVSLAYALSRPGSVAGVLDFSGFLADTPVVAVTPASADGAPIFWAHGLRDATVPFYLAQRGRARLEECGADVTARDYDTGHWIAQRALNDVVEFIDAVAPLR